MPQPTGILPLLVLLLFSLADVSVCRAQEFNLVPNGGFEEYTECPPNHSLNFALSWFNPGYGENGATPDYFNLCSDFACPFDFPAHAGEGLSGVYTFIDQTNGIKSEYIGIELFCALQEGADYSISYWTKRSPYCMLASSGGMNLWQEMPHQTSEAPALLSTNGFTSEIILDTNWIQISFLYTASGNERFITLGNHYEEIENTLSNASAIVSPDCLDFSTQYPLAYYYFDDVKITIDPAYFHLGGDTIVCQGDMAQVAAAGLIDHWEEVLNPGVVISTNNLLEVSPQVTTTYRAFGMVDTLDITVHVIPHTEIFLGPDIVLCDMDTVVIYPEASEGTITWTSTLDLDNDGQVNDEIVSNDSLLIVGNYSGDPTDVKNIYAVIDNGYCTSQDVLQIQEIGFFAHVNHIGEICEGEEYYLLFNYTELHGYDGYTTYDDDGLIVPSTLIALTDSGTYHFTTTYQDICVWQDSLHIVYLPPQPDSIPETLAFCEGDTLNLDFNELGIWSMFNGEEFIFSADAHFTLPGTWDVHLGTECGNFHEEVELVTLAPYLVELPDDEILCDGEELVLHLQQNDDLYQLTWQDGTPGNHYVVSSPGTYWVTLEGGYCTMSDTIEVGYQSYPIVELGNDTIICPNSTFELDAGNSGAQFLWEDGSTGQLIDATSAGEYEVVVSINGCASEDSVTIFNYPDIEWHTAFPSDTLLCSGETYTLSYQGDYVITWPDGSTGPSFEIADGGSYIITGRELCNTESDTINVNMHECNCGVFIPGSITVGHNCDVVNLNPKVICEVEEYLYSIYNSAGKLVFRTSNTSEGFGGACSLATDLYIYDLRYKLPGASSERKKGKIVVVG